MSHPPLPSARTAAPVRILLVLGTALAIILAASGAVGQLVPLYAYQEGSFAFHYQQWPFGPYSGDFAAEGEALGYDGSFAPGQTEAVGGGLAVGEADTTSAVAYGAVRHDDGTTDIALIVVRAAGELVPGSYPVDTSTLMAQIVFLDGVENFTLPDSDDPADLLVWFQALVADHKLLGLSGAIVVEAVGPTEFRGTFAGTLTDPETLLLVAVSAGTFDLTGSGVLVAAPAPPLPAACIVAAPNPFNPLTRLTLSLERGRVVDMAVFDLGGRRLRTLHQGPLAAGDHTFIWNGSDDAGRRQSAGTYLVRATGPALAARARVTLVP